jgi:MFS family permease
VTSPYRQVLSIPGALLFSATGLVARMPLSMFGLGIVLLVSAQTGSYATAGGISASYVVANAVAAVPLARLVDVRGQGRVLGLAVTISIGSLALLILAVEEGWPAPLPHLAAIGAGIAFPNVGAAVRERWAYVEPDPALLHTAFSLEAVNDEVVFIVGPTVTTLLAAALDPVAGLVTAGAAAFVGTWALVAQRRTEPPRGPASAEPKPVRPMPWLQLTPLTVAAVALGVLFGGCEVAVVAFTTEEGVRVASGFLLALWALGSMLAGLVSGALVLRTPPDVRFRWALLTLGLAMVPLPFVDSVVVMAGVLFLAGFAISPTLIAAASWVQALVPADRLNEGMTVFGTGLVAGVGPGAAIVGVVVDAAGPSVSFWIPAGAGLAGAAVAFVGARFVATSAPARGVQA